MGPVFGFMLGMGMGGLAEGIIALALIMTPFVLVKIFFDFLRYVFESGVIINMLLVYIGMSWFFIRTFINLRRKRHLRALISFILIFVPGWMAYYDYKLRNDLTDADAYTYYQPPTTDDAEHNTDLYAYFPRDEVAEVDNQRKRVNGLFRFFGYTTFQVLNRIEKDNDWLNLLAYLHACGDNSMYSTNNLSNREAAGVGGPFNRPFAVPDERRLAKQTATINAVRAKLGLPELKGTWLDACRTAPAVEANFGLPVRKLMAQDLADIRDSVTALNANREKLMHECQPMNGFGYCSAYTVNGMREMVVSFTNDGQPMKDCEQRKDCRIYTAYADWLGVGRTDAARAESMVRMKQANIELLNATSFNDTTCSMSGWCHRLAHLNGG